MAIAPVLSHMAEDIFEAIQKADYKSEPNLVAVGVVKAEGEKCDRCWNYSTHVGEFSEAPTINWNI